MSVEIRALGPEDDRGSFRSGDGALDGYFHRYAGQNQFRHHIGVTYVALRGDRIVGFATVSAGSLDADDLPSGRKMPPYPLPVLRVARLAVDQAARGEGVGTALLRFSFELAEKMSGEIGCVGILVDAKQEAVDFYRGLGFQSIEVEQGGCVRVPAPVPMFLPLGAIPPPPRPK